MVDDFTFGKFPAAIVLAKMINEQNFSVRKIANKLNSFNRTLRELEKIDSRIGIGLSKTVMMTYSQKAELLPAPFNTYMKNVISTKHKLWLEKQKATVAYKDRKIK